LILLRVLVHLLEAGLDHCALHARIREEGYEEAALADFSMLEAELL